MSLCVSNLIKLFRTEATCAFDCALHEGCFGISSEGGGLCQTGVPLNCSEVIDERGQKIKYIEERVSRKKGSEDQFLAE